MAEIQTFSYHTHTNFSDGSCSLREMVRQAKKIGFTEMGVSDHLIVHKNMKKDDCWEYLKNMEISYVYNDDFKGVLDLFKRHCEEIRKVSKEENFKLYTGFEVDYFPYDGWEEEFKWFIAQLDVDYLHTGNHFFCDESFEHTINMSFFKKICTDKGLYREYMSRHFKTLQKAVESKLFTFLAHIDYVRSLGKEVYDEADFGAEKKQIIAALEKTGTALELSTKGLRKVGDFYGGGEILREAAEKNIAVIISDDAHRCEELGAGFEKAEEELKKYGISKRLKF